MSPDLEKLRAAYQSDAILRQALDFCATGRRQTVQSVAHLRKMLDRRVGPQIERDQWLSLFTRLEEWGWGRLLQPTQRVRARFDWRIAPREVVSLAKNPALRLSAKSFLPGHAPELPGEAQLPAGKARHVVPLSPGRMAELILPADFTQEEAQWLGQYLVRCAPRPGAP